MQAIARCSSLFRSAARAGPSFSFSLRNTARTADSSSRFPSVHENSTARSSQSCLPGATTVLGPFSYRFSSPNLPGKNNSRFRCFFHSTPPAQRPIYRRFEQPQSPGPGPGWQSQGKPGRPFQQKYLLIAIGVVGGFYLYNLETVEVSLKLTDLRALSFSDVAGHPLR